MKRIHLFEFEDQAWFPTSIRTGMTNLIVVLHKMMGTQEVIADLLAKVRAQHNFEQIVDMGSGSGGAMPPAVASLNEKGADISLLLTDLFPNPEYVREVNAKKDPKLQFREESLDATKMAEAPGGLKTMANSFHHMPPEIARQILKSAQDSREPFLIYEIAENKIPTLIWWLLLPISLLILQIMVLFMTPFVRPLSWQQLVFTYLIPIIPFCYAWDGQVSAIRMYTFDDVRELLKGMETDEYTWEMAPAKNRKGKSVGYYVLGLPK